MRAARDVPVEGEASGVGRDVEVEPWDVKPCAVRPWGGLPGATADGAAAIRRMAVASRISRPSTTDHHRMVTRLAVS